MSVERSSGEGASRDSLSHDAIYSILMNDRRRYALHYLKQQNDPVSVDELVKQVAAWENAKPVDELTSQERKRVYISFHQSHLQTMVDQGVIEYDGDGTVALSESVRGQDIYLEVVPRYNIPWSLYYIGLSLAHVVLLALWWFDVPPFDRLSAVIVAVIVIVSSLVSASVHLYSEQRMKLGDQGPPPGVEGDVDNP